MEKINDILEIPDKFDEDIIILMSSKRDSVNPMNGIEYFIKFGCWDSRVYYNADWIGIVDKINDNPYTLRYLGKIDLFEESEIINSNNCYTNNKYLITTSKHYQLINPVDLDKPLRYPRYELIGDLKQL